MYTSQFVMYNWNLYISKNIIYFYLFTSKTIWAENYIWKKGPKGEHIWVSGLSSPRVRAWPSFPPSTKQRGRRDRERSGEGRDDWQSILRAATSFFSAARSNNFSKTRRVEEWDFSTCSDFGSQECPKAIEAGGICTQCSRLA